MNYISNSRRTIRFSSAKNNGVVVVNSGGAREYARQLEGDEQVLSYKTNYPLDKSSFLRFSLVGIRRSYLEKDWMTDFYITKRGGHTAIREIATQKMLSNRAVVERLEFSRRYWEVLGIKDWKVVLVE